MKVIFGRRPGPGAPSAQDALRSFLVANGGQFSGAETLTEDQFIILPEDPKEDRTVRFAARRADGSWAAVVDVSRGADGRWRDEEITICGQDTL